METNNRDEELDVVSFVTLQDGDDLIVSFAIADEDPGEIVSLILVRTPKYEPLLPADERGVSVSHESFPDDDDDRDRLRRLTMTGSVVTIETTRTQYNLDVTDVDRRELLLAQRILKKMNFDRCFVLQLG
ncbi:MAG: hypothetical protein ACRD2A_11300 [Vicinamibacterales bacterium]